MENMHIEQLYDEGLAHASYVVLSNGQAIVIDPGRDPQPYYDLVAEKQARIVGIIETHPHADFVSSHKEMAETTGAPVYVSKKVDAGYPHRPFDEGQSIKLNGITLRALDTPGHSPDSISIVLEDEHEQQLAVFTGDTLFIGDVGRPDLREDAGSIKAEREKLARMMYQSTREKLMKLDESAIVYPAHGAGSLCGKGISEDLSSTLGRQLRENPALQPMTETAFVDWLLDGQPFIPKYFGYDVELNKMGAPRFASGVASVPRLGHDLPTLQEGILIVDTRDQTEFRQGHYPGAINIMEGEKFETWLGSIIDPEERFYLVAASETLLETVIRKAAKIGYELLIEGAIVYTGILPGQTNPSFDIKAFSDHPGDFTILDIRNDSEVEQGKIFEQALHIPLHELRERTDELPTNQPVVVHCAGGYRSAAGASIVDRALRQKVRVLDMSEAVKKFQS